ncbi:MAG: DNA-directed RNA polymerase subunit omega [Luteitalea sp.]|nr:DNA-directed RNA polymerase subunit omega [Luteitalea sp.]
MIDRDCLPNAFEFVVLSGLRVRQLIQGCVPRVPGEHKLIVTAQHEVLSGKVAKLEPQEQAAGDPVTTTD